MTSTETPQQTAERIVREVRAVASQLTYVERAELIRAVVHETRNALNADITSRDVTAPQGREWEFEGLDPIGDAAEEAYYRALKEQQGR